MIDWNVLGIEPTTELIEIKKAYARKVKEYHPEDDLEGFQHFREAYEAALKGAADTAAGNKGFGEGPVQNLSAEWAADDFMRNLETLYADSYRKNSRQEWQLLLAGESQWDSSVRAVLYDKVSVFLQDHHEVPYEILVLLNQYFHWTDQPDELIDIFLNEEEIIALGKITNSSDIIRLRAASILLCRGIALQNADRHERASAYYDKVERMLLDINHTEAIILRIRSMFMRARMCWVSERYEQALEIYNSCLILVKAKEETEIIVYKAYTLLYIGHTLSRLKDKKQALAYYKKVIRAYKNSDNEGIKEAVHIAKRAIKKTFRLDTIIVVIAFCFFAITRPGVLLCYLPLFILWIIAYKFFME